MFLPAIKSRAYSPKSWSSPLESFTCWNHKHTHKKRKASFTPNRLSLHRLDYRDCTAYSISTIRSAVTWKSQRGKYTAVHVCALMLLCVVLSNQCECRCLKKKCCLECQVNEIRTSFGRLATLECFFFYTAGGKSINTRYFGAPLVTCLSNINRPEPSYHHGNC